MILALTGYRKSGKTTAAELLTKLLADNGYTVWCLSTLVDYTPEPKLVVIIDDVRTKEEVANMKKKGAKIILIKRDRGRDAEARGEIDLLPAPDYTIQNYHCINNLRYALASLLIDLKLLSKNVYTIKLEEFIERETREPVDTPWPTRSTGNRKDMGGSNIS